MKLLTIDDLYNFCLTNNFTHFSSSENNNEPIIVHTEGQFSVDDSEIDGMLFAKLKVCHTLLNRNKSFISEKNMTNALPTLKYRPILAHIHQLDDGEWDFHSHDIAIVEDENGEEQFEYIERQVGAFTADDPYLQYDEEMDKTYVMAKAAIPENYTKAADIIRRKNGTKVSCELAINDLSFNAKEKYMEINDFYFLGCTLLGSEKDGTEIGEGMEGSKLSIEDFSTKQNFTVDNKLVEMLEKLNKTLESFQINSTEEGGKGLKFEELLAKYGKTVEDIDFDYSNMTDEELEAKFAESFEGTEGNKDGDDPEDNSDGVNEPVIENESVKPEKYSVALSDGTIKEFVLSLDEINNALYALVNQTYGESDNAYYGVQVYENSTLVMVDWWNNKAFRQTYSRDGESFSLTGDRVEVFSNWLTKDEEAALAEMKSSYSVLKQFKEDTEKTQLHAQREAILADEKFESIKETEAFKNLVEKMDEYAVADLEKEAKVILADNYSAQFALQTEKKPKTIGFSMNDPKETDKPYGNLFD